MTKGIVVGLVAAAFAVPVLASLSAKSGLQPGESVSPFHPKHMSGPLAGTTNCFPCTFQARPQVQVWVNGDSTENVMAIAKDLQANMDQHKDKELKAMIVMVGMSTDCGMCANKLKGIAEKSETPDVDFALIGKDDPAVKAYKINLDKEIKNTVIAYKGWKVTSNMTNVAAGKEGCTSICEAVATVTQ